MYSAYEDLLAIGKKLSLLKSLKAILNWDQETFMPKGALSFRSEQNGLISTIIHETKTGKKFTKALSQLINLKTGTFLIEDFDEEKKINLREWRSDYLNQIHLPAAFVTNFAKITSKATSAWSDAKKNNCFNSFAPYLESILSLCMQKADYLTYEDHPYDALLSLHEKGMTTKKLRLFFAQLKPFLKNLLKTVANKPQASTSFLQIKETKEALSDFNHFLLNLVGINSNYSRLDHSEHPFCFVMHPSDVRLTTCKNFRSLIEPIRALMHEAGHALYELSLPKEHFGSPLGEFASMGIHESQSRFFETFIGLSRPFWQFAYPKLQKMFPKNFKKIDLDTFYQGIISFHLSPIRISADEISYILHIILRFEIELLLFEEKLKVKDLPDMWNQKTNELLGIQPQNDREGCLQDIHWAAGFFGYFPCYALGTLYAGQIYETLKKTFPDFETQIASGNFSFIHLFLNENIYRFGRRYQSLEIIEMLSKEEFSPLPYMNYLKEKYSPL